MVPSKFCAVKLGESTNQPIWSHMRVESFSKISGGVGTYRKCQMSGQIGGATRPPGAPTGGRLRGVYRGPRVRPGPRSWSEKVQARGGEVKSSAQDVAMQGLPKRSRLRGSDGAAWVQMYVRSLCKGIGCTSERN